MAGSARIEDLTPDQLRDEVAYWRAEASAMLFFRLGEAKDALKRGDEDATSDIVVNRLNPLLVAVQTALMGDYHDLCEGCLMPLLGGQPVMMTEDVGELHAACMGASEADIAAGEIWVAADQVASFVEDEPVQAREDGNARLPIYPRAPLYDPEELERRVAEANAWLADYRRADTEAEAAE